MWCRRLQHELVVYAFDLLHRDGKDLRALPLIQRRQRLERLLAGAEIACLLLVEAFDDRSPISSQQPPSLPVCRLPGSVLILRQWARAVGQAAPL
jgi:hypothetical protein